MNLIRGLCGGRADLEHPPVIGLALGQLADAGSVGCMRAQSLQSLDLAREGRGDRCFAQLARALFPVTRNGLGVRATRERGDQFPARHGRCEIRGLLPKYDVDDKSGRDHAQARIVPQPLALPIQALRVSGQAQQIRFRILGAIDLLHAGHEVGNGGEEAATLAHDVRRAIFRPPAIQQ